MVRDTDSNILSGENTPNTDEESVTEPWEGSYIILNLLATHFASQGDTENEIETNEITPVSSDEPSEDLETSSETISTSSDQSGTGSGGYMTIGPSVSGTSFQSSGKSTSFENPCVECTSFEEFAGIPGRDEVGPTICENDKPEIGLDVDSTQED
ncbi:unnamed protein product [Haemonchus placei]|uniref:Uncharacterized protein n=1 Tax=Haemonchus placei TaxID=6290 RepID=A0A0N4WNW9_HAEPC|nr:unnamed protein product [Haemonchus placei]